MAPIIFAEVGDDFSTAECLPILSVEAITMRLHLAASMMSTYLASDTYASTPVIARRLSLPLPALPAMSEITPTARFGGQ